jgi:hypothetical protein
MTLGACLRRASAFAFALAGLAVAFVHGATAAPRAAELGAEVALGAPSGGFVGRLKVEPTHGPVGTPVTVTGEGFPAGQALDIVWSTVTGHWNVTTAEYFGREFKPAAYRITQVMSDGAGRIAASFEAPDDFGFQHDIQVQQGNRLLTRNAFNIDMTVKLLADDVPVGTPLPIEVHGIGWRELEDSWVLVYDNKYTGWISATTTFGSAQFTVPATGRPGRHVLEVIHSDFTFPYRNKQQTPAPDRPQFKIGFNITPGSAVMPPPPEQQALKSVRRLPPSGELVATPAFAGVGQPVVVKGSDFVPGKPVVLNWMTYIGNRITGRGWEEDSSKVAEATADASGNIAFYFNAPDDLGAAHTVWADAPDGARKTGNFWITPTALPLDVGHGPVETTFKLHLKGVGWSETANIYHLVYDNDYIGYACAFNSQGDVELIMKATGEPGWHFIDLYPGIYKGTETRPNNFRIPQLTYAADHPGEDLPAFHFAFEVTGDASAGLDR